MCCAQADSSGFVIRFVDVTSGVVTTLAGRALLSGSSDGSGTLSTFLYPLGVALDAGGFFALVVRVCHYCACVFPLQLLFCSR